MNGIIISLIMFVVIFGGAVIGIAIRSFLPERHMSEESRNMVVLGMGIVATMAALVLGFLIEGAKDSFREQRTELIEMSAKVVILDDLLSDYGPGADDARNVLRASLARTIDNLWPGDGKDPAGLGTLDGSAAVYDKILSLDSGSGREQSIRDQTLTLAYELTETRDALVLGQSRSVPSAFLISLGLIGFWFVAIFFSFGLYAPTNGTVIATLVISALSVAIALFIIMELNMPFDGLLKMPSAPLAEALQQISR